MLGLVAIYLLAVNAATIAAFAFDKRAAARRGWRIPERRLLMLAAFGGSPGALVAQQALRHKTRKEPFRTSLWVIVGVQIVALAVVAYRLFR
ncbi:MAG: DUF1294 domain-containing protein [Alphaproteobacteria bacterium]|nr:DUF1294 domain-containing protein [Alphaproteobacteria bacterium]MBU1516364.1 DUF1294 domain-containing protein [Alphaproteobacteria bacterium]MBU2093399.1 DUF1294 domain-containing protein [Alphaproteobacteria bacterium]MBU2153886.1 DUF1294 domain-containing protein [Alphaproteobacteria bacterium]MBU2307758.1 DUF1294 domain-containing protein [Alphaproteobacteria bacterium]